MGRSSFASETACRRAHRARFSRARSPAAGHLRTSAACRRAVVGCCLGKRAGGGVALPGTCGVRSAASCGRASRTAPIAAASAVAVPGGIRWVPGKRHPSLFKQVPGASTPTAAVSVAVVAAVVVLGGVVVLPRAFR